MDLQISRHQRLAPYAKRIAATMISLRNLHSLRQTDLANKLNIPVSTISRLETGLGNPSLFLLIQMSEFFDVPVADFFLRNQFCSQISTFSSLKHQHQLPRGIQFERIQILNNEIRTFDIPKSRQYLVYVLKGSVWMQDSAYLVDSTLAADQVINVPGACTLKVRGFKAKSTIILIDIARAEPEVFI